MITIERARLDLQTGREAFATELYGRWDSLYPTIVERVIDEVLCRYDREDEVIRLESICLDLGEIGEPEFYREFPKRLAEKLDDFFADCLKFRGKYPMEVIPVFTDKTKALLFFLLYGFFVQGTPVEFRGLAVLLKEVVENNGARFIHFLKEYGNVPSIRERLVFQFSDEELEIIVKAAEPSEAAFIQVYVRYLIVSHGRLGILKLRPRNTVMWCGRWCWLICYMIAEVFLAASKWCGKPFGNLRHILISIHFIYCSF